MKQTYTQRTKLANYFRNRRKYHNMTQQVLANRTGVSFSYISKIEGGQMEYSPSLDFIRKCIDIFGDNAIDALPVLRLIDSQQLQARAAEDYETAVLLNRIAAGETLPANGD